MTKQTSNTTTDAKKQEATDPRKAHLANFINQIK